MIKKKEKRSMTTPCWYARQNVRKTRIKEGKRRGETDFPLGPWSWPGQFEIARARKKPVAVR